MTEERENGCQSKQEGEKLNIKERKESIVKKKTDEETRIKRNE